MKVGGIDPFSLIDFPGKTAAVVFTQGCNFRCPYCYVPQLVIPEQYGTVVPMAKVWRFLEARRAKIDGVVITGGEPTIQEDLEEFVWSIKKMGFLVKLDTNGSHPEVLEKLIKIIDYVAMDFKAPLEKYTESTRSTIKKEQITQSISLLLKGNIEYEFRTTLVSEDITFEDFKSMVTTLSGAKKYVLQKFLPASPLVDPSYSTKHPIDFDIIEKWKNYALKKIKKVIIRNY
ncbi:anaerobic ribonucleoside-triphosphate reductase activating protein [Methylacidiphilum sp. Yel]|uniref:anaerobic ribonucleoside-triphosphate reductase activating protein n=1 Tax=Methylacidiphilum sp. Yel TaxID=1847730 RepID=UPI00106A4217|nr:anaerobic ribonucleoside-triphosphate reductase activating protein [Methylacidiphilum sp. Yel]TFE69502.1 anaerobic ribonucleoside-triphosphate reductase activating protein [Methylacidiphilum sp. Yel]